MVESTPFQSLLELSALTANNPAQAALVSAILNSSGSFPLPNANNMQSLLCNPAALAAVYASAANALSDLAAATGATTPTTNLNPRIILDDSEKANSSPRSPLQQECANCGVVTGATQLKRYGNLSHYLCSKCGNASTQHRKSSSDTTSSNQPGRKVCLLLFN